MKKYIIASAFSSIPVILFGIIIPLLMFFGDINYIKSRNPNTLLVYIAILAVAIAIILTTNILSLRYADSIDDLDKERERLYNEKNKLKILIEKYNKLIVENSNK